MSLLAQASIGPINKPVFALVYAESKVGKSTFGASAPTPFFCDFEDSSELLNVTRLGSDILTNYDVVKNLLVEMRDEENIKHKSIVLDSADRLESMIFDKVVQVTNEEESKNYSSIEDIGYSKGYIYALNYWTEILSLLREIQRKQNMHVIIIGHANVKRFNDPYLNEGYDRFVIKLHHKAGDLVKESVDMILFMRKDVSITKDKNKKVKAFNVDEVKMHTQLEPAFDAGSRLSLPSSFTIPEKGGFNVLLEHIQNAKELTPQDLVKQCLTAMQKVNDNELKVQMEQSIKENKDNSATLRLILEKITEKVRG